MDDYEVHWRLVRPERLPPKQLVDASSSQESDVLGSQDLDALVHLHQRGSLDLETILDLFNIDPNTVIPPDTVYVTSEPVHVGALPPRQDIPILTRDALREMQNLIGRAPLRARTYLMNQSDLDDILAWQREQQQGGGSDLIDVRDLRPEYTQVEVTASLNEVSFDEPRAEPSPVGSSRFERELTLG